MVKRLSLFFIKVIGVIAAVLILAGLAFYIVWSFARAGKINIPVWVQVQGTSMEPTLHNGVRLKFNFYFPADAIRRGDIVVFSNNKTTDDNGNKVSYVKRVIGLPGDEVMLQDGFIKVNGKVLNEPYISVKKSTFSESFTPECKKMTVPADSYFVLGDNRADSKDSRDFGFVKKTDVRYIIYYQGQITTGEFKVDLTASDIIKQINAERVKNNLAALKENSKIDQAAGSRANAISESNDWTTGATKSNFTYNDALSQVGYSNIVTAEIFDGGYLNVNDLFASWHKNQKLMDVYLNSKFQDIGASVTTGNFQDCKVPVVSVIFGGYTPPNYDQATINSWETSLQNLKNIQGSWQSLANNSQVYNAKHAQVDRLNTIISLRIDRISSVIATMQKNEWFSDEQNIWLKEDLALGTEQNQLADELNSFIKNL